MLNILYCDPCCRRWQLSKWYVIKRLLSHFTAIKSPSPFQGITTQNSSCISQHSEFITHEDLSAFPFPSFLTLVCRLRFQHSRGGIKSKENRMPCFGWPIYLSALVVFMYVLRYLEASGSNSSAERSLGLEHAEPSLEWLHQTLA